MIALAFISFILLMIYSAWMTYNWVKAKGNFMGVGIYRDWEWKGKKTGGLHLDMRTADHRALWFCYKNRYGKQEYVGLTLETLKGFGVV